MTKRTPSFLSRQNLDSRLKTLAAKASRSVLCRSSTERRRRKSFTNPLTSIRSEPLPERTPMQSTECLDRSKAARSCARCNRDIAANDKPDSTGSRVAALTLSHRHLVRHRRRLARDQVHMQSDLSNVNNSLRFLQASQDRLISALAAICQQHPELISLRDTCRTDCDDLRLHCAALRQSEAAYTETIARMQARDNGFVTAAVSLFCSSQPNGVSAIPQSGSDDDVDGSITVETMPQLLIDYHEQKGRVAMLEERAVEVEADYQEQLASRDFMEEQDHDQAPESSREEFVAEHLASCTQSAEKLEHEKLYLARLERKCREEKLDMSPVRRPSSDGDEGMRDPTRAASHGTLPASSLLSSPDTDHSAARPDRLREHLSPHSNSLVNGQIDRWFDNLSFSSDLEGEASRISNGHDPETAIQ